ncbi:MAG: PAS domain S-box protein [bacterium]
MDERSTPPHDGSRKRRHSVSVTSDELYLQLVERSIQPTAIVAESPPRVLLVNEALLEVIRLTRDELLTLSPMEAIDFIHPEARAKAMERLAARMRGEPTPDRSEYRLLLRDGAEIWVEVSGIGIRYQGHAAALMYLFDITRRVEAEAALRLSERQYRTLAEQSLQGLSVLTADPPKMVFVNPAFCRIVGRTAEEILAIPPEKIFELMHPDDRERALGRYSNRLTTEPDGISHEYRLLRPNGDPRWVEAYAVPIEYGGERALQVCYFDITDRKRAEEERLRLEGQMQRAQKLESLAVLAGGVAHDFNNLLLGMLTNLSLVRERLAADAPVGTQIQGMEEMAHRAADLCRQMLAYAGRGRVQVRPVDLSRVVGDYTRLLEVSLPPRVELCCDLCPELPAVEADETQLGQVLMNLIANAQEAIDEQSGTIRVQTGVMTPDDGYLAECEIGQALPAGPAVYLEVSDTGCGMAPETRERIFEPFFSTKFTGRGLGLAATLGVVHAHRGAVHVHTTPGHGTTVRALLPPSDEHAAARQEPMLVREAGLPENLTVLVVDDDLLALESQRMILEHYGVKVHTAAGGEDAIALFRPRAADIDVVVLDQAMPRMDGVTTFLALREIRPEVRVLLCSGYCEDSILDLIPAPGPAAFLRKPYDAATLLNALGDALRPPRHDG